MVQNTPIVQGRFAVAIGSWLTTDFCRFVLDQRSVGALAVGRIPAATLGFIIDSLQNCFRAHGVMVSIARLEYRATKRVEDG